MTELDKAKIRHSDLVREANACALRLQQLKVELAQAHKAITLLESDSKEG